ncbi:DcrB-related protein [Sphingomonas jatrophae]|uniref:DUF1795 domain-containing protein n=1 Tax=Sphingomonas jatrophae TaxID=1166337 RepID=A0A1I6M2H1_9SPHN|nr:DcrB-related protein [Sphingomonas jatrophae]SFS09828.1 hypothetical protein SAMN05192580_3333 [Sphingomonas jatrophae]
MPPYRTNDATFDVPQTWQDQSITAFRLPPAPGGGDASFVVTQDAGKGVLPFDTYFEQQAESVRRGLPEYEEVRRDRFELDGREAAWLEFRWTKDRVVMQLRQVYFDCGFKAVICTLTALPANMEYHDPEWRRVMKSLAFTPQPAPVAFP